MPGFNIENFKANFEGGARSYLFYYIPRYPGGVSDGGQDITYLVRTTSLPETTLEETIVNWQGFDFKFAAKNTFADFVVTFNVDKDAKVRKLFENWMTKIHNPETNEFAKASEYMIAQRIQLLDYDGSVVMQYVLHHAWPKSITAITLDYASTEVAQFDVNFSYAYHTIED
jgi:hypothetical protein